MPREERAGEFHFDQIRLPRAARREDDGVVILQGEAIEEHRTARRGVHSVEQTGPRGEVRAGEGKARRERARRENTAHGDRLDPEGERREEAAAHLKEEPVGLHDSRAEERLQTQRRGVEIARAPRPEREVQADVEEPLRPLRHTILQLERILKRGAPIGIAASAGLLHQTDRRGELGDAPLEERHHRGARALGRRCSATSRSPSNA